MLSWHIPPNLRYLTSISYFFKFELPNDQLLSSLAVPANFGVRHMTEPKGTPASRIAECLDYSSVESKGYNLAWMNCVLSAVK